MVRFPDIPTPTRVPFPTFHAAHDALRVSANVQLLLAPDNNVMLY